MKNKICVYTCITGNYDRLNEIENKEKMIDYYCFTNNKKIKSNTWNIIYIEDLNLSNVELARKIKILGHPIINEKYDIQLWMDGNITFKKEITEFIKTYLKKEDSFVAFKHGERKSVKEEGNACIKLKKEKQEKINKLIKFYEKENYKDNNGLIESTVYIKRPKDKLVQKTMKLWFDMIVNYTTRDQLSFNYCIYKTGLKVKWINEKVFDNDWFSYENHNFEDKIESYRLYFGDENNYIVENDLQGEYKRKGSKYTITTTIPNNADTLIIEFSKTPGTILKNMQIKNHSMENIVYFNFVEYKGKKVFYNKDAIIKIKDNYIKGKQLTIELELEIMDQNSILNLLEKVCITMINKQDEIKLLKKENERLQQEKQQVQQEKDQVINSKGWQYLEKLRKIRYRK